jgi:hypothetical protein
MDGFLQRYDRDEKQHGLRSNEPTAGRDKT